MLTLKRTFFAPLALHVCDTVFVTAMVFVSSNAECRYCRFSDQDSMQISRGCCRQLVTGHRGQLCALSASCVQLSGSTFCDSALYAYVCLFVRITVEY